MYSQTLLNPLFAGITGGGIVLDPEAAALIAAMTVPPDETRQLLINDFFVGLKADFGVASIADIFDIFYMMAAHDSQAARLNWVNPATFTLSPVNAPTFTVDRGYVGNGTSSYLNTTWVPSTNGVRYTLNNASLGVYVRSAVTADSRTEAGAGATTSTDRVFINSRNSVNTFATCINSSAAIGAIVSTSAGLSVIDRDASNSATILKNGVSIGTSANVPTVVPVHAIYVCAFNAASIATQFSTRQVSAVFAGRSMTVGGHLALFNRIEAYLDAIGAGVIT